MADYPFHYLGSEIVMTIGRSKSVENFLIEALEEAKVSGNGGRGPPKLWWPACELAKNLADAWISTLVVSDAAVFALMARVNKVIVGCHAGIIIVIR